jgi:hypothetical protein
MGQLLAVRVRDGNRGRGLEARARINYRASGAREAMTTKNNTPKDGGPAFPRPIGNNGLTNHEEHEASAEEPGMSLRDYFAGQALAGWLATYGSQEMHPSSQAGQAEGLAAASYGMADAMLRERAR